MIPYKLDYTIERILKNDEFNARKALKTLTGKTLTRKEAESAWSAIQDHKWPVSRRLGRDIGLRVAATDYLENFYEGRKTFYTNLIHRFKQPGASIV